VIKMARNGVLQLVCGVGTVACLVGLFANLAVTPAAYSLLDALFAGGFATAMISTVFVNK
jgi:hypothetical protein